MINDNLIAELTKTLQLAAMADPETVACSLVISLYNKIYSEYCKSWGICSDTVYPYIVVR